MKADKLQPASQALTCIERMDDAVEQQPSVCGTTLGGVGVGGVRRVQLSRKKGWRLPPNTVVVSRPSRWGNPFKADWPEGGKDRDWAVSAFRGWIYYHPWDVTPLRGKNLACWCPLDQPCHADVLLEIANSPVEGAVGLETSHRERKSPIENKISYRRSAAR